MKEIIANSIPILLVALLISSIIPGQYFSAGFKKFFHKDIHTRETRANEKQV